MLPSNTVYSSTSSSQVYDPVAKSYSSKPSSNTFSYPRIITIVGLVLLLVVGFFFLLGPKSSSSTATIHPVSDKDRVRYTRFLEDDNQQQYEKLSFADKVLGSRFPFVRTQAPGSTIISTSSSTTSDDARDQDSDDLKQKREEIKKAMIHAYGSYEKSGMGHDEIWTHTGGIKDWTPNGMALTLIDSLDTLYIMDLQDYFNRAVDYMKTKLRPFNEVNVGTSVFETTIRVLGGCLSAYELSGDPILLQKAIEIADVLMYAFDSPTGVPYATLNFATKQKSNQGWTPSQSAVLAEFATLQIEFRRLSAITKEDKYDRAVTKVMDVLERNKREDGLFPVFFDLNRGAFVTDHVSMGALGDSAYEYFLKQWLLTSKTEKRYLDLYRNSVNNGILARMIHKTDPKKLTFVSELRGSSPIMKMDHLACFVGGMLGLGVLHGACQDEKECDAHLTAAKGITELCYEAYHKTATGLGPETMQFTPGQDITPGVASYILRPETMESIFYMYRITGDEKYRNWGWEIFQAIEKHCKANYGYSGVMNVNNPNKQGNQDNVMQSFFLAETLKYIYLLFTPKNVIDLQEYVFNTEAHPLKIYKP